MSSTQASEATWQAGADDQGRRIWTLPGSAHAVIRFSPELFYVLNLATGAWLRELGEFQSLHTAQAAAAKAAGIAMPAAVQGELLTPAPRANKHGDPCPAWCVIDHQKQLSVNPKTGKPIHESQHSSKRYGDDMRSATVVKGSWKDAPPEIKVSVHGAPAWTAVAEAEYLAKFLREIAEKGLTPDQLRQLAAAVDQAAKDATR